MIPKTYSVKLFCQSMGEKDPFKAIEKKTDELIKKSGMSAPFFDPKNYIVYQNIVKLEEVEDLNESGKIIPKPSGFKILINKYEPKVRKNFTLCHEIAHTFFMNSRYAEIKRRIDPNTGYYIPYDEEEIFCDHAAANLLMPTDIFRLMMFRNYGPLANSVLELSKVFRTSLCATAKRMIDVNLWKINVSCWSYTQEDNNYNSAYALNWNYSNSGSKISSNYIDNYFILEELRRVKYWEGLANIKVIRGCYYDIGEGNYYATSIFLKNSKLIICILFNKYPQYIVSDYKLRNFKSKNI